MNKILAPQLNANDDEVFIAEWKFENNQFIQEGDHVVSIESAKVVEEIYSEGEGYLEKLFEKDDKVKAGQIIANLNKQKKTIIKKTFKDKIIFASFTKKAEKLIKEYNIQKKNFQSNHIIKESDVIKFIKDNKISTKKTTDEPKNNDQLIILNKENKPYHAAVYLANLGIIDLSLLGSKITKASDYHFDDCKCYFFYISLLNKSKVEKFYREPFLLTNKIIKKEKSSRGWSRTVESSDFILKYRKNRSKNFEDMNCIEWLVYGLELGDIKIPNNVLTASILSSWAIENLKKIEKNKNHKIFNKYY